MKVLSQKDGRIRRSLHVTREGIEARYERPKAGGGYYVANSITIPWRKP